MDSKDYWYIDDGLGLKRDTLREIRSHVNNSYKDYEGYVRVYVIHVIDSIPVSLCTFTVRNRKVSFTRPKMIKK